MFYPVESLKRGGRFYLCWVADSWPLRFAAITHRQLWSQDIRQLCDDLLEVMMNESGQPTNRFSLRLSSQLMRGLVRLYERKVTVLLGDLCMINATVFKSTNRKHGAHETQHRTPRRLPQLQPAAVVAEEPTEEQRVEEMIQNSGNVVSNIQDITLKEAVIPDFQLPPNDNFGEENPDQHLQSLLGERSVETMMRAESALQTSGALGPLDATAAEPARSPRPAPRMEPLPDLDSTLFRKSTGEELLPAFEKDVPEIPEVPIPAPPIPDPTEPIPQPQEAEEKEKDGAEEQPQVLGAAAEAAAAPATEPRQIAQEPVDEELEELEEQPPAAKRRRLKTRLIIDKKTRLASDFLRARIDNPNVDLRCKDFSDAIVSPQPPAQCLLQRPAHGFSHRRAAISVVLVELYAERLRQLPLETHTATHSETETEQPRQRLTRSRALEQIPEVEEQQTEMPLPIAGTETRRATEAPIEPTEPIDEHVNVTVGALNVTADVFNVTAMDVPNVEVQDPNRQEDISDLPTQKLETLSQARKRTTMGEDGSPPKRLRSGYLSFRESLQRKSQQLEIVDNEPEKENIPPNVQERPPPPPPLEQSQMASRMLAEAGLSDGTHRALDQPPPADTVEASESRTERQARKTGSDGSETPLGSLDRTRVSLGDSVRTTESQMYIRHHFGVEGTMLKIMEAIKAGGVVDVARLLRAAPPLPGHRAFLAARCFVSVLRLKHHGFVRIVKNPDTLEIKNISLGPKFDNL